jgi:hypothetical protein
VTLLVHGEAGLATAQRTTGILYGDDMESLGRLSLDETREVFRQADFLQRLYQPGLTVLGKGGKKIKPILKAVLGIRDILVWIRGIRTSDYRIRIQLLSSVTLRMKKKINIFSCLFSYNLPTGTLVFSLKIKFFAQILF